MPIDQMIHLLRDLRLGKLDAATTKFLGGTPLGDLVSNLLNSFPVLFQERVVGRKREVGMARSLLFRLAAHRSPGSRFQSMELCPVLWRCVLVSGYDDAVSEITQIASIDLRPAGIGTERVHLKDGARLQAGQDFGRMVGEETQAAKDQPLGGVSREARLEVRDARPAAVVCGHQVARTKRFERIGENVNDGEGTFGMRIALGNICPAASTYI